MKISESTVKSPVKDFFKGGYVIGSLLVLSIIAVIVFVNYCLNIYAKVLESKELSMFMIIVLSFSALIILLYFIATAVKGKMNFAHSVSVGLMLSGVLFILYVWLQLKVFTATRIGIAAGLFAAGLIFTVIMAIAYKRKKDGEPEKVGYFGQLFKKFNFPFIILFSVVIACGFYLATNVVFSRTVASAINKIEPKYLDAYIALGIVVLTAIITIGSRKTEAVDALLLAAVIALPVIFTNMYFINSAEPDQLIICGIIFCAAVILILARKFLFFDPSYAALPLQKKGYFKAFSSEYGVLSTVSVAALSAVALFLLYGGGYIEHSLKVITLQSAVLQIDVVILPVLTVAFGGPVLSFIISLINIKTKKLTGGDFCTLYCLLTFIMLIPYAILLQDSIAIAVVCAIAAVSAIILGYRIRIVSAK